MNRGTFGSYYVDCYLEVLKKLSTFEHVEQSICSSTGRRPKQGFYESTASLSTAREFAKFCEKSRKFGYAEDLTTFF